MRPNNTRILFVDRRCCTPDSYRRHSLILSGLGEAYDVVSLDELNHEVVDTVRRQLGELPFSAIVTHAPPDRTAPSYSKSLNLLAELRDNTIAPIVLYTGMDPFNLQAAWNYVDAVITKTADCNKDLDSLMAQLGRLLAEEPFSVPLPVLQHRDGWITLDAKVNHRGGWGLLEFHSLLKACDGYLGRAILQRIHPVPESDPADIRNPLHAPLIYAAEGSIVRIRLEGEDEAAKRLAKCLYGLLTSRYLFQDA